jgi:hypothetical protein
MAPASDQTRASFLGFALCARTHLSDDETVAKMGHPDLDVGHPPPILRIVRNPLHYQVRVEIADDARLAVVGRYVILFHILERCVRIERVVFGGRDLPALLT